MTNEQREDGRILETLIRSLPIFEAFLGIKGINVNEKTVLNIIFFVQVMKCLCYTKSICFLKSHTVLTSSPWALRL